MTTMRTLREELHEMIDRLPESEVRSAHRFVAFLGTLTPARLPRALAEAIEDDEPDTPEEAMGAAEAWAEYQRGERISAAEMKRELRDA